VRVAVAEGGEPAEACILQLLRAGAMPRRGAEGRGRWRDTPLVRGAELRP
jgi:hypothetical protein